MTLSICYVTSSHYLWHDIIHWITANIVWYLIPTQARSQRLYHVEAYQKHGELRDTWPIYLTFQIANNDGADQTVHMRRLVCAFVIRKQQSQGFLRGGTYDVEVQASWPPSGYVPAATISIWSIWKIIKIIGVVAHRLCVILWIERSRERDLLKVKGTRLTGGKVLCPWTRHFILCLVLVQHRKDITEKLLTR